MKKLINAPASVLADALTGVAAAHPDLAVDFANRVVSRGADVKQGKVALISGGGSGHEPLHSGFVGLGMLDAACAGEVFTSPTPDQMLAATQTVSAGAGVLYIVKNDTGDVLNFEMAAELAEAEGIPVKSVLVADDVAVEDSTWTAGRRMRHPASRARRSRCAAVHDPTRRPRSVRPCPASRPRRARRPGWRSRRRGRGGQQRHP